jgi:hypothetical protein
MLTSVCVCVCVCVVIVDQELGAPLHHVNRHGRTALMDAASAGALEAIAVSQCSRPSFVLYSLFSVIHSPALCPLLVVSVIHSPALRPLRIVPSFTCQHLILYLLFRHSPACPLSFTRSSVIHSLLRLPTVTRFNRQAL